MPVSGQRLIKMPIRELRAKGPLKNPVQKEPCFDGQEKTAKSIEYTTPPPTSSKPRVVFEQYTREETGSQAHEVKT